VVRPRQKIITRLFPFPFIFFSVAEIQPRDPSAFSSFLAIRIVGEASVSRAKALVDSGQLAQLCGCVLDPVFALRDGDIAFHAVTFAAMRAGRCFRELVHRTVGSLMYQIPPCVQHHLCRHHSCLVHIAI